MVTAHVRRVVIFGVGRRKADTGQPTHRGRGDSHRDERLHVLDAGALHVGMYEEYEAATRRVDLADLGRGVLARGPDVEVEVSRGEVGRRVLQVDGAPVRVLLGDVEADRVGDLGHLGDGRGGGRLHADEQPRRLRSRQVDDAHLTKQVVLDVEQLAVRGEEVRAHDVDLAHDHREELRLEARLGDEHAVADVEGAEEQRVERARQDVARRAAHEHDQAGDDRDAGDDPDGEVEAPHDDQDRRERDGPDGDAHLVEDPVDLVEGGDRRRQQPLLLVRALDGRDKGLLVERFVRLKERVRHRLGKGVL
mmetsp:Transcript_9104/g.17918  ORF Transcript_9104/g.17918 Transcript_9104/m.17918 type:complete len:307 (+) Transcript_9104:528-1448(+)